MAMKRCPVCGERYSDTYKDCPFCEEDKQQGRVPGEYKHPKGWVTPLLILSIIIMAGLLVYLLKGDQLALKFSHKSGSSSTSIDSPITPVEPTAGGSEAAQTQTGTSPEPTTGAEPLTGAVEDPLGTGGSEVSSAQEPEVSTPEADFAVINALSDGISLSRKDFTLSKIGETYTLKPSGGSGSYTWVSENPAVATVDAGGKVTAVANGTIHVLATDGSRKGSCIVRVNAPGGGSPASGSGSSSGSSSSGSSSGGSSSGPAKLNRTDFTIAVSEGGFQLKATGVDGDITWTSSNDEVARVSASGMVTPVSKGTATVTASWDGGSLKCIVRVSG